MRIDGLPARKRREIHVGRRFILEYNRLSGRVFTLDESYWDVERDPSPDLRFASKGELLFAEIVSFDEVAQEAFVRAAASGRLLTSIDEALVSAGATGFVVRVEPADLRKVPQGRRLKAQLAGLVNLCIEKSNFLKKQQYQWHEQHEQAWKFALDNIRDLDITLCEAAQAYCEVSEGVRRIDTAGALKEAIQGKGLKRYPSDPHLLIDHQGRFVGSVELLQMLDRVVTFEGYAGVWYVNLIEGKVEPLHQSGKLS